MTDGQFHKPVMIREVVESLRCKRGGIYLDGTIGGGGHAYEVLKKTSPDGILIGIDIDEEAILESEKRLKPFGKRKILLKANYADIANILADLKIPKVDGILLDLGVSSHQFKTQDRGFSFSLPAPLDMRMDRSRKKRAYDLINTLPDKELERIIRDYGEEMMAPKIVKTISTKRKQAPIRTTAELAAIIMESLPPQFRQKRIHPATKTFQAIRIAVNDELLNLTRAINSGIDLLDRGGRFSVISFHSLEDRIVKNSFRSWERGCICPADLPICSCGREKKLKVLTRKPVTPSDAEILSNPSARSAKLRTAERI